MGDYSFEDSYWAYIFIGMGNLDRIEEKSSSNKEIDGLKK